MVLSSLFMLLRVHFTAPKLVPADPDSAAASVTSNGYVMEIRRQMSEAKLFQSLQKIGVNECVMNKQNITVQIFVQEICFL
jgi:hypothetical protein